MPGQAQMTYTDLINQVFDRIIQAADDSLLTVTLTRFAIYCANHPRSTRMIDTFVGEFYLERGRLNDLAASTKAKANQIRHVKDMVKF